MRLQRVLFSVVLGLLGEHFLARRNLFRTSSQLDLGGKQMPDPEFDHVGYQVTWQDENENLWVAPVDPDSGDININDAEMLARGLAPNAPISSGTATGNGPEWVYTNEGSQILYTLQEGALGPKNWRVAVARKSGMDWVTEQLGVAGGAPDGTKVTNLADGDPDPLINFYFKAASGQRKLAWLHLNDPTVGSVAPFRFTSPARWASEEHVFVSTVRRGRVDQVVLFDPPVDAVTQLTFDRDVTKSKPQMWQAPEFGNERVFFALESPARRGAPTQIGVYRENGGSWTKFKTIIPPSGRNFPIIDSPEHFVFKDQSYIVMAMTGNRRRTEIWIAGIGEEDFYRKVAGPDDGVASTDPEYLIIGSGDNARVVIYLAQNGGKQVYRADTGL